jgi:hypothetical protein
MISIDNVGGTLDSPSLALALTAITWEDRILGRSETVASPNRATWSVTGNNVQLGGDLPRRCYWVHLDARLSRPWTRSEFRHPDLLEWAKAERGNLITALLILARAWVVAKRPKAEIPPFGNYNGWARVIGGILAHAKIEGFLANLHETYDAADTEGAEWEAFLRAWRAQFGDRPVTVAEVAETIRAKPVFGDSLPGDLHEALHGHGSFNHRLGRAIARREGARHGDSGLHLVKAGKGGNGRPQWVVKYP